MSPSSTTPSQPVAPSFEREYGCPAQEGLRGRPAAGPGHAWRQPAADSLHVAIGPGTLAIDWQVLPPRVIALIRLPRMAVSFRFQSVEAEQRQAFMKRFDLHLQRGGG
ncbi:MAG: hypothetical protein ACKOD9_09655 [Rubrivivax sp.]